MTAFAQPDRVPSQRALALQLGISHVAVQKAVRSGRIRPEPDGTFDVAKSRADLATSADPTRKTAQMGTPTPRPAITQQAPRQIPIGAVAPPQPLDGVPRPQGSTFHDARTANEVLKAQERRLRLEQQRGKLVDKARALMLVHRLAKEERDAILAWPARVAAEIAAELGVDQHQLQTLLDQKLREHLSERHDARVAVS